MLSMYRWFEGLQVSGHVRMLGLGSLQNKNSLTHTWGCITRYHPSEWIEPLLLKVLPLCLSPLWVFHQPQGTRSCVRLLSNSVSSLWRWTATLSVCVCVCVASLCAFVSARKQPSTFNRVSLFCVYWLLQRRQIPHWYCAHTFFKFASVRACMCALLIPGHSNLSD